MPAYVFVLEPEKKLYRKIVKLKTKAKMIAGEQPYLSDPPHLTLYVGRLKNKKRMLSEFHSIVEKIRGIEKNIRIKGWHTFKGDSITGKETLVCSLDKRMIGNLRKIQDEIVNFTIKYWERKPIERYKKIKDNLNPELRNNLDRCGYPFIGKIWDPHIGIASFDKVAFKKIWLELKNFFLKGEHNISAIVIYELNEKTEKLRMIKKYKI